MWKLVTAVTSPWLVKSPPAHIDLDGTLPPNHNIFHRVMDSLTSEFPHALAIVDDKLFRSKKSIVGHIPMVEKNLEKLGFEYLVLKISTCSFAKPVCKKRNQSALVHRLQLALAEKPQRHYDRY